MKRQGILTVFAVCLLATLGLLLGGCPQPESGGSTAAYTVSFEANGGTPVPAAQTVAEGDMVTEPVAMTKTGHSFGGWYKEAALTSPWNFGTDTVTADMTLYAKWTVLTYTVSFEADDGIPVPAAQTVAEGGKAETPPAMTKTGHSFGGWYKEAALTNLWDFATDTVTADMTLYAKWEVVISGSFALTWELNGGAWTGGTTYENQAASGSSITQPADPVKEGFLLAGWYTEAGLTNLWDFSTDTVTADMTLYAKWGPARTITFNAKGGTPAPEAQTVAEGGTIAEPPTLTKTNHTFGGWYKEAGLTNQWNFTMDTVMGNITLYARWMYNFTTPAQFRDMVPLTGATITGDAAYYYYDQNVQEEHTGVFIEGRTVTISPFSIAKYETTYELWYEVYQWANGNGYVFANAGVEGGFNGTEGTPPTSGAKIEPVTEIEWWDVIVWCNAYSEMSGKEPVYYTDINYDMVLKNFANDSGTNTAADNAVMKPGANGYRLPTEAEWEYAARGGGTPSLTSPFTDRWAGTDSENSLGTYAWYHLNSRNTQPVGIRIANAAGLHDMSGNVAEWCWDWYGSIGTGAATDPTGAVSGTGRVVRGGSWDSYEAYCTVTSRYIESPSGRNCRMGFRVVCP